MNTYEMLMSMRDDLGEGTEAHWSDLNLLRKLNVAQGVVGMRVGNAPGDWLLKKSVAVTAVDGKLELPSDCLLPVYVEEVGGGWAIPIRGTVRERREGRLSGGVSGVEAYLIGNYVEVNQDGYGNACYIWYQPRVVDLHAGVCGTSTDGTHVAFEVAHWPSGADDYYNGVTVEVRDATSHVLNVSTLITDYVGSTGVATIGAAIVAPASGDFYGTVSQLPVEFHEWVVQKAVVNALAKPSSTFEKEIFGFWKSNLRDLEDDMEMLLASRVSGSTYTRIAETD